MSDDKEKAKERQKKKDQRAKEINSNEQYVLAQSMDMYIDYYNSTHKGTYPPKNYTSIVGKNVQKTRSHLFGMQGMEKFMNMNAAKLSSLIPRVRLLQERRSASGKVESEAEIVFEDFQRNPEQITSSRGMRGSGAGLKSVSIDMEGDNIATSDRMYKVKLDLYFSSLEELFRRRPTLTGSGEYQYVDMFKLPKGPDDAELPDAAKIRLLRLEYGYYPPSDSTLSWTESEKTAIREAKRVLTLNLYKHSLDYNENGSINVSLEYHGYTERRAMKIDVFDLGLSDSDRKSLIAARDKVKKIQKGSKGPLGEKDKKLVEKEDKKASELRKKGYQSFMNSVMKNQKMYVVSHQAAGTGSMPILYPWFGTGNNRGFPKTLDQCFVESPNIAKWYKQKKPDDEAEKSLIQFFYLGDLLDNVIGIAKEDPGMVNGFEFSFGSFLYGNLAADGSGRTTSQGAKEIPISGIPISQAAFADWFKENVLEKGERIAYSLLDFLTDMVKLAMVSFSLEARANTQGQAPSSPGLRAQSFNTSSAIPKGEIANVWTTVGASQLKNGLETRGLTENYFFYGVNLLAEDGYSSNQNTDADNGIYWLVAASEHGVTKKIKYTKNDTKFLTEARMTSGGFSEKKRILWSLYKANVDMVGNAIFKPGMVVFITSNAFNQDEAEDLGLAGYFMVIKVRNSIEGGRFKTELETIWTKPSKQRT